MSKCFTVSGVESQSIGDGITKNSDSNILHLPFNVSVVADAEFYYSQPSVIYQAELIESVTGFRYRLTASSPNSSEKIVVLWEPATGVEIKFSSHGCIAVPSRNCALVQLDQFSFITASWRQGLRRRSYKLSCIDSRPVLSVN